MVIKLKKTIPIYTILFTLSIILLTQYKTTVTATPTTLHVPTQYPTIQEAINHANPGDTIFVHNGTYREHVIVNKSVSLIGEHRDSTIIDGQGTGVPITITANNVYVKGFTIKGSGSGMFLGGILITHSDRNRISQNKITNNYDGISIRFSSHNIISDNLIFSNTNDGIGLHSSTNNTISTNTIFLNDNSGVGFYVSSNNIIYDNTIFSNNYHGVALSNSGNNFILYNVIKSNSYYGVIFYPQANKNIILGNLISSNNIGMYISSDSKDNIIYHNNFNNTNQVWVDSKNIWDNGYEGNYWSTYKGYDLNSDGIGDVSYSIGKDNVDNYPLMGMFSIFNIALMKETFSIATICNSTISDFRLEIGSETGNRIIRFTVTGKEATAGFCRIMIPTGLMSYPYIVLVDIEEIVPKFLDVSNETHAYLYFNYTHGSHTITIISSKTLRLYNELFNKYNELNATYYNLLYDYSLLWSNYSQLQDKYNQLFGRLNNVSDNYASLLIDYSLLWSNYSQLQDKYNQLFGRLNNVSDNYASLLIDYSLLWSNYSQLQDKYNQLNSTYQEHEIDYSRNVNNVRNLAYIFAAMTAIFLMTTVYLSKHAHGNKTEFKG
jgi:nitrous oxidase accessory protein